MQRVEILRGTVENGRTGDVYHDGEEAVLADSQVDYLGTQVATLEWIDENADADGDGIPDALDDFNAAEFVDQDYSVVVQAIERGAVDGYLGDVWDADLEERDGRVSVQEALRERGYEPDTDENETPDDTADEQDQQPEV